MKRYTIFIVIWLCFCTAEAQKITEKHIGFSGKESLKLDIQISDSINLYTWNKDEIYVTASVNVNENKDNDAYLVTFDESGSSVSVKARFADNYFKGRNNCCNESKIFWQVYMPEKTGFSIETIDGNITIAGKTESMKVKTISGYIDLAVPSDRNADLEFSTISGSIYSNHELTLKAMHNGIPSVIKEKINNGGPAIRLETISGDIFFRKAE